MVYKRDLITGVNVEETAADEGAGSVVLGKPQQKTGGHDQEVQGPVAPTSTIYLWWFQFLLLNTMELLDLPLPVD